FFDALAEFFFIRTKENFVFNIGTGKRNIQNNIANHLVGFDVLFRIPGLRFTEIYQEFYFDDVTMNLFTNLNRNLGYHGGLFVPRFTRDGRLSLRVEYTRTPTIFYKGSSVFTSGYTFSQHILGSDLGPLGQELFTEVKFKPAANTSWATIVDFQKRGVDRDTGLEFLTRPDEDRIEIGGVYTKQFNAFFALSLDVRYQRILSFDNVRGDNHNAYFSGVSIQLSDFFNKAVIQ
ncbi:MAG: capsule assembly Wzi family protein, partial [bacterium]